MGVGRASRTAGEGGVCESGKDDAATTFSFGRRRAARRCRPVSVERALRTRRHSLARQPVRPCACRKSVGRPSAPPRATVVAPVAVGLPPPFDAQARVPRGPAAVRSTGPSSPRLGHGQARVRSVRRRRRRTTATGRRNGPPTGVRRDNDAARRRRRNDDRPAGVAADDGTRKGPAARGVRRGRGRPNDRRRPNDGGRQRLHDNAQSRRQARDHGDRRRRALRAPRPPAEAVGRHRRRRRPLWPPVLARAARQRHRRDQPAAVDHVVDRRHATIVFQN